LTALLQSTVATSDLEVYDAANNSALWPSRR
jgi:hypothetical protein